MTDEMINDLARAFYRQKNTIKNMFLIVDNRQFYTVQLRDDIIAVAQVIHKHRPDYNLDTYYELAGYEGPHPRH